MRIPILGSTKELGDGVFFIAEIGKNFIQTPDERPVSEYLANARRLVDAAIASGADAVKFQTHEVEDEVLNIDFTSPHFRARDRYSWVSRNTAATPLDAFWIPLKQYCDERGVIFFSTPMSRKAARKLQNLDVPMWKVGSGDVQDYVLLDHLIGTGKPIIISTGMVSLSELSDVISYIRRSGSPLAVLYCVSEYPCPPEKFNLSTISRMIREYPEVVVGFSDHSLEPDATFAAIGLGARIIEKHFSFSRDLWGADHKASLSPAEFKAMVDVVRARDGRLRDIDSARFLGSADRELEGATNQYRPFFNKALVAGVDIAAGAVLTSEMVYAMRPVSLAGGLPAHELHTVLGRRTKHALLRYDPISADALDA